MRPGSDVVLISCLQEQFRSPYQNFGSVLLRAPQPSCRHLTHWAFKLDVGLAIVCNHKG